MINPKNGIHPPSYKSPVATNRTGHGHRRKYNWDAMVVGSYFTIPVKGVSARSIQGSIITTAKSHCLRRGLDWTFTTRAIYDNKANISNIRIWRTS